MATLFRRSCSQNPLCIFARIVAQPAPVAPGAAGVHHSKVGAPARAPTTGGKSLLQTKHLQPTAIHPHIALKILRLLLISFVTCHSTLAVSLPTTIVVNGEVFTGVVYMSHDASQLVVQHRVGIARFPIASLSPELKRTLGYDSEAAKAAEAKRAAEAERTAEAAEGPRIKELKTKAANGDAQAAFFLAERYESGQEVELNLEKALAWLTASAKLGSAQACFKLGRMSKDFQTEMGWYRKAAERGDTRARNELLAAVSQGKIPESYMRGLEHVTMYTAGPETNNAGTRGWRTFKVINQ